ncbi:MAG: TfoX/Sxy family protein [Nitrososphaerales archaeon]
MPKDSRITIQPMFGNLAGFVNGNMFTGLYGDDLFVRLFGDAREELLKLNGTSIFEPMKGRQMKDYVAVPKGWTEKPEITMM